MLLIIVIKHGFFHKSSFISIKLNIVVNFIEFFFIAEISSYQIIVWIAFAVIVVSFRISFLWVVTDDLSLNLHMRFQRVICNFFKTSKFIRIRILVFLNFSSLRTTIIIASFSFWWFFRESIWHDLLHEPLSSDEIKIAVLIQLFCEKNHQ